MNSLEIVTLLDKPNRRKANIEAKYVGKKIPDEFVVGYGLTMLKTIEIYHISVHLNQKFIRNKQYNLFD